MATQKRRWLYVVSGVAVLLVFAGIGVAVVSVAWFRENLHVQQGTDASKALAAFDATKRKFPDPRPVLEFGEDRRPTYVEGLTERRKNPGSVTAVQVLAWDPEKRALADVTLPFWLLRLKSRPIVFGAYITGFDDHGVTLTAADIERFGPGVLFDYELRSGQRVLVSAQ